MNVASYIKETKAEMKHVSWPTRHQVLVFTAIVIAVSLATALLLGLFDFIFSRSLGALITAGPAAQTRTVDTGGLFRGAGGTQGSASLPSSPTPTPGSAAPAPIDPVRTSARPDLRPDDPVGRGSDGDVHPGGFSPKAQ